MLFLAINLGFVAENYREERVEEQNELHYMKSFLYDLHSDTLNLSKAIPFLENRMASMDSVFRFFKANPTVERVPVFPNMDLFVSTESI
jgi:hypothetical protein